MTLAILLLVAVILGLLYWLYLLGKTKSDERARHEQEVKALLESKIALIQGNDQHLEELLRDKMQFWQQTQLKEAEANFKKAAELWFETHKRVWEEETRADAIARSRANLSGKFIENVYPFTADFEFNPGETRFIGEPIDLLVFEKSTLEGEEVTIRFLEVKTGKSQLSEKQRRIRDAVIN